MRTSERRYLPATPTAGGLDLHEPPASSADNGVAHTGGLRRRQFLARAGGALLATSTLGSVLAACGGSGAGSASGGGVGGSLSLLSWEGYQGKGVVDRWLASRDVRITENLLASNEEVLTKLKAGGLGTVSLTTPNVAYIPQLVAARVLQPIDVERIPNLKNVIPALDRTARESAEIGGELYAIPYMWGYDGMAYNASKIAAPPRSWRDVLDAAYTGKVVMISGAFPNFEIWPRVLGYDPLRLTQEQLDSTVDFLIDLKQTQVRTVTGDQSNIADLLARGDAWVTGSGCWIGLPSIAPKGDEVAFTIPEGGGGTTWIDTWAIPADAPNLDTVYAYLNEMMSPRVQAQQATTLNMATSNAKAVPLVSPANRKLYGGYDASAIGSELSPLFRFPEDGYTTSEDWNRAWARVQAA